MSIRKYFPYTERYAELQMTSEGKYSVTWPVDAQKTCDLIRKFAETATTIIDATACVGGDTIAFARNFNKVYAVEKSPDNYAALVNNLRVYNLKNVQTYNGDICDFASLPGDVFYADPPWGGPEYKHVKSLRLTLGGKPLLEFVKLFVSPRLFVFKLPPNYDFTEFDNITYTKITYKKSNGKPNYDLVFIQK